MSETAQISAQAVNDLRARTGAGLMDCKRALVETQGDAEKAIDLLRKKGLASAAKKADRTANDGLVVTSIAADQKQGAMVQISCETDFVAKTDDFKGFCKNLADHVLTNQSSSAEAVLDQTYKPTGQNVKDSLSGLIAKLGENMAVKAATYTSAGYVEQYIHIGGKVGVLLSLNATKTTEAALKTLAKDICMHIAASSPSCVSRNEIDPTLVAKEKEIAADQAKGKPAQAVEKIVSGKLEKFYAQSCLLEQPFVKNPEITVGNLVAQVAKQIGDEVSVKAFSRFQVGA